MQKKTASIRALTTHTLTTRPRQLALLTTHPIFALAGISSPMLTIRQLVLGLLHCLILSHVIQIDDFGLRLD